MTWFALDDKLHSSAAAAIAGANGVGAYALSGSWCADHRTDGKIPREVAHRFASAAIWKKVVASKLVTETEDGYELVDYLRGNPSRAQIEDRIAAKSEAKQKAGRAGGLKSGETRRRESESKQAGSRDEAETEADGKQTGTETKLPSPSPPLPLSASTEAEIPHSPQGGRAEEKRVEVGHTKPNPIPTPAAVAPPPTPAPKVEAHVRYADSYADGIRKASGQDFAPPRRSKADLIDMAVHFGKAPGGAKLTGDDLLEWFRRIAAEYWRATNLEAKYQSGFSPKACLKWLNEGRGTRSLPYARAPSPAVQPGAREGERSWTGPTIIEA